MRDSAVGISGGSKVHVQKSVSPDVAPGRDSTSAGHDPLGRTVRNFDHTDMGTVMGIESNQLQRGIPVGGGQHKLKEQVRRNSWVRKGDSESIKYWNNMFLAPSRANPKLDFYAPACVDGVPEIHPSDEAVFE